MNEKIEISRAWFNELIKDSVLVESHKLRELEIVREIWDRIEVLPEEKSHARTIKLDYNRK